MRIEIEVPNYPRYATISNNVRPKHWEWKGDNTWIVTSSRKKIKFPDRFSNTANYQVGFLIKTDLKMVLCNGSNVPFTYSLALAEVRKKCPNLTDKQLSSGKFLLISKKDRSLILANPRKANKENAVIINGQNFYNGTYNEFTRGLIMKSIKESFVPYLKNLSPITNYPISIECIIYDTFKGANGSDKWDVINRGYPYIKGFTDLLVTGKIGEEQVFEPKLIDDSVRYVGSDGKISFVESNQPKLKFIIKDYVENT